MAQLERRVSEAVKLGFRTCFVPHPARKADAERLATLAASLTASLANSRQEHDMQREQEAQNLCAAGSERVDVVMCRSIHEVLEIAGLKK